MTPLLAAWQQALAAEHAAVFGYGVLGPQLSGADQALAIAFSDAHEQLRDRTEAALVAAGASPVQPAADYPQLYGATTTGAARSLAARLEDDCAEAWRYLYYVAATTSGTLASQARAAAQTSLTASAVRTTKWRQVIDPLQASVAFPGM